MNILHLSNVAGRKGGGVSEVVHTLVRNQNSLTVNSDLWFMGRREIVDEIHNDILINKTNLMSIPPFLGINNTISPLFFLNRNKVSNKYDLVHQHGIFLPISILTLSLKNTKIIINPHGYLEPEKLNFSKLKKQIALFLFENRNLKNCDCLVACSKKEASSLRKLGFNQPIVILANGVDDSILIKKIKTNKPILFKNRYSISKKSKILLFLSRIHPWKGLKLLLKSILIIKDDFRINNWKLIIAGPNELNHLSELESFVNVNDISDLVNFIGPQYGQNKLNIIDSADCHILPTKGENFGISVIESLARGVPVITTKTTPWEELSLKKCGWWIERSEKEFVKVLLDLINTDNKTFFEMGCNGIKLVKKKYLWSKISNQTINMYKWVLNDFDEKYNHGFDLYD